MSGRRMLAAALLALFTTMAFADAIGPLLQQVDYLGADYAGAVRDGRVVNEAEYAEMREFAGNIVTQTASLKKPLLAAQARELQALVAARAAAEQVRARAESLSAALTAAFDIRETPAQPPDPALGRALYATHCAGCHGAQGRGDGPQAAGLQPAPANFHDVERFATRKPYSLYATIGLGVSGTSMPGFAQLSDHERWSLAATVGAFSGSSPVARARVLQRQALALYAQGDAAGAYARALSAYLDGFELAEGALSASDPALKSAIEAQMLSLRAAVQNRAPLDEARRLADEVDAQLALAEERLGSRKLDGAGAASAAFIILLREGLEAILVIAALGAFLVKTGQTAGLRYLYAGGVVALLAGWATWWVSEHVFAIGGLQRELTEGLGALIAAAVMFSVGFWMHGRSQAVQWQQFIQSSVRQALSRGTLWGLAGLSFIAVYRECFETVLFYQALWAQTAEGARGAALGGIGAAALALLVLAWAILKYSVRLPLREFFAATGVLLFVLAVVFAGKGIVATQAAGWLPVTPLAAPHIEWLGLYPNAQSLLTQAVLLVLAGALIWRGRAPVKA